MPDDIDIGRLIGILDAGEDAQRRADGLSDQVAELRAALHHAQLAAEHSKITVLDSGKRIVQEVTPAAAAKVTALTEQLARLDTRRAVEMEELLPAIALARRFYEFARANRLEVGRYAL
jgi:predicted DCC family thiol-disulfide oxidoreductase YuxK